MTEPTVRVTAPGDVPAILEIGQRGWNAAYGEFLAQETIDAAIEQWYDSDRLRETLRREAVTHLVAEFDNEVVGYVSGGPAAPPNVAILGAIYVDPDRWNQGIGSALLAAYESARRERGEDRLRFRVLADNDVGKSFYRRHGYEVIERTETDLFGQTVPECVFGGPIDTGNNIQ